MQGEHFAETMHKRRAAQESLKAPPLLGWRLSADLHGLYIGATVLPATQIPRVRGNYRNFRHYPIRSFYIPGKPGMIAGQSGAVLRFEAGKPGINADWREARKRCLRDGDSRRCKTTPWKAGVKPWCTARSRQGRFAKTNPMNEAGER